MDSWSGQCEKTVREVIPPHVNLKLKIIPKGTTGMIQPLDVYGFRLNNFVRKFSDIVILLNYNVNLHERNNIIRMQSLTHNQPSSQRFQDVFKYGWCKSGYAVTKPTNFKNPVEFCFITKQEPIRDMWKNSNNKMCMV